MSPKWTMCLTNAEKKSLMWVILFGHLHLWPIGWPQTKQKSWYEKYPEDFKSILGRILISLDLSEHHDELYSGIFQALTAVVTEQQWFHVYRVAIEQGATEFSQPGVASKMRSKTQGCLYINLSNQTCSSRCNHGAADCSFFGTLGQSDLEMTTDDHTFSGLRGPIFHLCTSKL